MKNSNIEKQFNRQMQKAAMLYAKRFYEAPAFDKEYIEKAVRAKRRAIFAKGAAVAAAAVLGFGICFGIGVNTAPSFAATVSDIPILSGLAKILTIEEKHEENSIYATDIKIPAIEGLEDKKLQAKINDLVKTEVDAAVEETKAEMQAEKELWLSLGGKEEDYMVQEIIVDYEVYRLTEKYVSFAVFRTQTSASAYSVHSYYNYDLETGEVLTLEAILGEDYVTIANEQILAGIAERSKEKDAEFIVGEEGFNGVTEDQAFYINEAGNPVIVFNKYEIAPGYMGVQEFEIVKEKQ